MMEILSRLMELLTHKSAIRFSNNSFIFQHYNHPKQIIFWLYVTYSIFKFKNKIKYKISVGKTFLFFLFQRRVFFSCPKISTILHVYARQTLHYPFHTINSKTFQQSETNCVQMAEEVNIFFYYCSVKLFSQTDKNT